MAGTGVRPDHEAVAGRGDQTLIADKNYFGR
jgi:hypothetical protein